MTTIAQTQAVPLVRWDDGTIRIGKTRVLLEMVVGAYNDGYSAEDIAIHYPTLDLATVYGVIAYYISNRTALDSYIERRDEASEAWWEQVESQRDNHQFRQQLRERMLKRLPN